MWRSQCFNWHTNVKLIVQLPSEYQHSYSVQTKWNVLNSWWFIVFFFSSLLHCHRKFVIMRACMWTVWTLLVPFFFVSSHNSSAERAQFDQLIQHSDEKWREKKTNWKTNWEFLWCMIVPFNFQRRFFCANI